MNNKNKPQTMLNKRTTRKYLRIRSALDARDMETEMHNIKVRFVAGEISEQDYKTLTAFYQREKEQAMKTDIKKYSYKPRKKRKSH